MAGEYKNSIKLGVVLKPTSEIQKELQTTIEQLEKNSNIDLKIDTKSINQSLKDFSDTLNDISSKMKNDFNFQGVFTTQASGVESVTNKLKEEQQAIEQTANTMKTLSTTMIGKSDSDGNITEVLKTVEQLQSGIGKTTTLTTDLKTGLQNASKTENFQKLDTLIDNLQTKLSKSSNNKFINESVITELQNKLNGINTNTAEKEIKELQTTINNLGSSDSQIVRLQNTISKMENNLTNMKGKYGNLVGDSSSKAQLESYTSQVEKLKTVLNSLQNGGTISGQKLASELNLGTNASRELSTAVKNSSNALKLAQADASSFSNSIKKAFENAGLYMSTYQAINMVANSFKDGIKTVIDMDTAIANLNKVVNMSSFQLLQMRDSALQMGQELGKSSIEVANAQAEFGRLYKTKDEINNMTKISLIGSNVMDGTSADEVAKSLTTILTSMKMEAKDSMGILDSMNEIQNNYRVSAKDMMEALAEVGSTAHTSGADLQKVEGYITSIAVATGEAGSEVGNALRTVMSRIYSIGRDGIEAAGLPEKTLKQVGVAVRDSSGQFREFSVILDDLMVNGIICQKQNK